MTTRKELVDALRVRYGGASDRALRVPLVQELSCKGLDVEGQRPRARLSSWCGIVASERHRPSP